MQLREDCRLTYVVAHEAWYGRVPGVIERPQLNVCASAQGGGVAWEFLVTQHDFGKGNTPIRLDVFDDAFAAFNEIPEFFAALGEKEPRTLADVVAILAAMGATDDTQRERPA